MQQRHFGKWVQTFLSQDILIVYKFDNLQQHSLSFE